MTEHYTEFPFDEIRRQDGDHFNNIAECKKAGFDEDQIWSLTLEEDTFCYGPSIHWINLIGYICTNERHDGQTYFMEEGSFWKEGDDEELF
jgi:hypothetical protein